jgi:hypothetical protein
MLPGKMRQYIVNRSEDCKAIMEKHTTGTLCDNLKSGIKNQFAMILEEFDKMERDLWETAGKPGRRSVFEEIFGK